MARFRPALAPTPAPASVLLRTPPLTLVAIVERKGQRIADTGMGIEPHAEHHVGGSGKQRQPLLAKSVTPLFLVRRGERQSSVAGSLRASRAVAGEFY